MKIGVHYIAHKFVTPKTLPEHPIFLHTSRAQTCSTIATFFSLKSGCLPPPFPTFVSKMRRLQDVVHQISLKLYLHFPRPIVDFFNKFQLENVAHIPSATPFSIPALVWSCLPAWPFNAHFHNLRLWWQAIRFRACFTHSTNFLFLFLFCAGSGAAPLLCMSHRMLFCHAATLC
jgi:hypothetical protein